MTATASLQSILDGITAVVSDGDLFEVRILGLPKHPKNPDAGYFLDRDKAAQCVYDYDQNQPAGIYITLNPPNPALHARAADRIKQHADILTSDKDILRRTRLLLDFDPVRPSGVSATDQEHEAAMERARACHDYLTGRGWPEAVIADSGNGAHLIFDIDLPNDSESTKLVSGVLEAISLQFSDNAVNVDTSVGNAGRITKLYGTMARKGDNTRERPHRCSKILRMPENREVVSKSLLEELAASVPKDTIGAPNTTAKNARLHDISRLLQEHAIAYEKSDWQGNQKWVLEKCPFDASHAGSAYIIQFVSGAVAFGCHHDSCKNYDWQAFKLKLGITYSEAVSGKTRTFRFLNDDDLDKMPQPPALIEGFLVAGALTALVGEPSSYKSFLALDWSLAIATGRAWCEHAVNQGAVVYVSGEGSYGLRARVKAWKRHNGVQSVPNFWLLPEAVNLLDSGEVEGFMAALNALPEKPVLVVIDTLARALVGGDENAAKDMGVLIAAAGRVHAETDAAVLFLHHVTKQGGVMRGSSALRGALDTQYKLARSSDNATLTCEKMKDSKEPSAMTFKAQEIAVGKGETSLVLVPSETAYNMSLAQERAVLDVLDKLDGKEATHGEWKDACAKAGIKESAFAKALRELRVLNAVTQTQKRYTLTQAGRDMMKECKDANV